MTPPIASALGPRLADLTPEVRALADQQTGTLTFRGTARTHPLRGPLPCRLIAWLFQLATFSEVLRPGPSRIFDLHFVTTEHAWRRVSAAFDSTGRLRHDPQTNTVVDATGPFNLFEVAFDCAVDQGALVMISRNVRAFGVPLPRWLTGRATVRLHGDLTLDLTLAHPLAGDVAGYSASLTRVPAP